MSLGHHSQVSLQDKTGTMVKWLEMIDYGAENPRFKSGLASK